MCGIVVAPMADVLPIQVVGVSHVAGKYNFTEEDYLNEGADQLHEMGCRVLKVWMTALKRSYPFNSTWPDKISTLTEMAKLPYFARLFEKPFSTFILEAYAPSRKDDYFLNGVSPDDAKREREEFAELTTHFLTTYKDSGKTFVL